MDGYQLMVRRVADKVRIYSRRGADFTLRFPRIVEAVRSHTWFSRRPMRTACGACKAGTLSDPSACRDHARVVGQSRFRRTRNCDACDRLLSPVGRCERGGDPENRLVHCTTAPVDEYAFILRVNNSRSWRSVCVEVSRAQRRSLKEPLQARVSFGCSQMIASGEGAHGNACGWGGEGG